MDDNTFSGLDDKERAILMLALALFVADLNLGAFSGTPAPPDVLARDMPIVFEMINKVVGPLAGPLDEGIVSQYVAKVTALAGTAKGDESGQEAEADGGS